MQEIDPQAYKALMKAAIITEQGMIKYGDSIVSPTGFHGKILLKNHPHLKIQYERYLKKHGN